ncbi:MAG: DUF4332 domain-containing protein [Cyanobacteriota bacterium]
MSSSSQPVEPCSTPIDWPLSRIPGISAADQSALKKVGIESTQHLLERGSTAAQQQALSTQLKIPLRFIRKWVALANLLQIPSVGPEGCGLLLHAGILSPEQLAQGSPQALHRSLCHLQVRSLGQRGSQPSLAQVAEWIRQAQQTRATNNSGKSQTVEKTVKKSTEKSVKNP